ncbi:hypothetical protein E6O75_ATG04249 [Venturia nashicola]|uniref:Uncharacterized protein n=1 Tax=Venturia nashicola TaxID=86259 RepID=A0A4Z1PQX8_9PEZI|nr:hypothetical protein E6O75_ATG04249 [Venturia nashicola]
MVLCWSTPGTGTETRGKESQLLPCFERAAVVAGPSVLPLVTIISALPTKRKLSRPPPAPEVTDLLPSLISWKFRAAVWLRVWCLIQEQCEVDEKVHPSSWKKICGSFRQNGAKRTSHGFPR